MSPIISIVIPVHNGDLFLEKTLQSIIPQLNSLIELVIINNASTDNTEYIVKNYFNNYIRYIKLDNIVELDINIKKCIDESYGEFVWFIGDDDLIKPGGVNYVLNFLRKYNYNIDYLFINCSRYNRDLTKILSRSALINNYLSGPVSAKDLIKNVGLNIAFTPTTIIKRSTWLSDSSDVFLNTGWYTLLNIINNSSKWSNFIISKRIIIFRDGSDRNSREGKFLKMIYNLISNLYKIRNNNSDKRINYLISQIANKSIFYTVMSSKIHGYNLEITMIKSFLKLYRYNYLYTIYSVIALLIPSNIYKFLFKYRIAIKKYL